jgi:hypothetical protein
MDPGLVVALVAVGVVVIAGLAYAGAGRALRGWRDGLAGVDEELTGRLPRGATAAELRESEIRQLLEAKSYRRQQRGLEPLDVEAELERLLAEAPPGDEGQGRPG